MDLLIIYSLLELQFCQVLSNNIRLMAVLSALLRATLFAGPSAEEYEVWQLTAYLQKNPAVLVARRSAQASQQPIKCPSRQAAALAVLTSLSAHNK